MAFTKLEKLMFPGFLMAFEVVFLILYALLVRYDDRGAADLPVAENQTSQASTIKTYPCELAMVYRSRQSSAGIGTSWSC